MISNPTMSRDLGGQLGRLAEQLVNLRGYL